MEQPARHINESWARINAFMLGRLDQIAAMRRRPSSARKVRLWRSNGDAALPVGGGTSGAVQPRRRIQLLKFILKIHG